MRRTLTFAALAVAALFSAALLEGSNLSIAQNKGTTMLSHDVYFTLKDNSPAAKQKLVAACKKYLTGHEGEVFYAAGSIAEGLKREVNDRDFDVALHIVFKDIAAHDKYQVAPRHEEFIKENKDNWKKVRVFDSVVER
jgi:hypothetical protein